MTSSIAKAIITMAHSLSMKVIAEGVEHERQLAFLAENDCDEVQGYLLSRHVPAPEMTRLMQGRWSCHAMEQCLANGLSPAGSVSG